MPNNQTNDHDHSAATQVVPITRSHLQEKLLGAHLKKGGDSGLLVPLVLNKHSLNDSAVNGWEHFAKFLQLFTDKLRRRLWLLLGLCHG